MEKDKRIKGVNIGNWLVLEKWMEPSIFDGTDAEDETWLNREASWKDLTREGLKARMKEHRDSYFTREDVHFLSSLGVNLIRIPVPYFVFGDRAPFSGCIEYVDRALEWAEEAGISVLIDLHTAPGGQNGYDNGGHLGVCRFGQVKKEVQFELSVLSRLAERYAEKKALFGIEVLNEPISMLVYLTAPSRGKARDREEAKGSSWVPTSFLKNYYRKAYQLLREHLPEEKAIVFHDGFRLGTWRDFFAREGMENVYLDTHMYIFAMEKFFPKALRTPFLYKAYLQIDRARIRLAARHTPVIVGEWCISADYGLSCEGEEQRKRFRKIYEMQQKAFSGSAGTIYWSYQLLRDRNVKMDEDWKEAWDYARCIGHGWIP